MAESNGLYWDVEAGGPEEEEGWYLVVFDKNCTVLARKGPYGTTPKAKEDVRRVLKEVEREQAKAASKS